MAFCLRSVGAVRPPKTPARGPIAPRSGGRLPHIPAACVELDECHRGMFLLGFARAATAARLKADNGRRSVFFQSTHDFMDALKIGMTAAEADAAEKQSFHNAAG